MRWDGRTLCPRRRRRPRPPMRSAEVDHVPRNSDRSGTSDRSPALARLRPYNLVAGTLHVAQALAIVLLANDFSLPVGATYMTGPPGPDVGTQAVTLFDLGF